MSGRAGGTLQQRHSCCALLTAQTNEAEAIDTEQQMRAAQAELMDVDRPGSAGASGGEGGVPAEMVGGVVCGVGGGSRPVCWRRPMASWRRRT